MRVTQLHRPQMAHSLRSPAIRTAADILHPRRGRARRMALRPGDGAAHRLVNRSSNQGPVSLSRDWPGPPFSFRIAEGDGHLAVAEIRSPSPSLPVSGAPSMTDRDPARSTHTRTGLRRPSDLFGPTAARPKALARRRARAENTAAPGAASSGLTSPPHRSDRTPHRPAPSRSPSIERTTPMTTLAATVYLNHGPDNFFGFNTTAQLRQAAQFDLTLADHLRATPRRRRPRAHLRTAQHRCPRT